MDREELNIKGVPATLWGRRTGKLFIAVHGDQSHKEDAVISLLAQVVVGKGYQVLSFDLPGHGQRQAQPTPFKVQHCVHDLAVVFNYARLFAREISLFGCSLGAYFSLQAYKEEPLKQCLFLSPVVDMQRIIRNMMATINIDEGQLEARKEIETPTGQTLYWDYYAYVKDNPITNWNKPTSILYGAHDTVSEQSVVAAFARRFDCNFTLFDQGEHYFHTPQQLQFYEKWLQSRFSA